MAGEKRVPTSPQRKSNKRIKVSGPSAPIATGDFPYFLQGTVTICLSDAKEDQLQLHRGYLARASPWFSTQFRKIDAKNEKKVAERYVFVLPKGQGGSGIPLLKWIGEIPVPELEPIDLTLTDQDATGITDEENNIDTERNELRQSSIHYHKALLGAIYSLPLQISNTDVEEAFSQCERFAYLSKCYGCGTFVRPMLSSSLSDFRMSLYESIAKNPVKWLNLAMSMHCGSIFSEAVIHCIGGYPDYQWSTGLDSLVPEAQAIVRKKASQLAYWRMKVDVALLTNTLLDDDEDAVSLESSTESWIAVSLFHDWVRVQLRESRAEFEWQSNSLYTKIAEGDSSYPDSDRLQELLDGNIEGFDIDSWEDLSSDLSALTKYARKEVAPLLKSRLMLDSDNAEIPYLTCMDVKPSEYPWSKELE